MSYEGHVKVLCEKGHLFIYDAFDSHVRPGWTCPHCGSGIAFSTCVDETNGIDDKTGLCPGDVKLVVKNAHKCQCSNCGNKHSSAPVQYHIPKARKR